MGDAGVSDAGMHPADMATAPELPLCLSSQCRKIRRRYIDAVPEAGASMPRHR